MRFYNVLKPVTWKVRFQVFSLFFVCLFFLFCLFACLFFFFTCRTTSLHCRWIQIWYFVIASWQHTLLVRLWCFFLHNDGNKRGSVLAFHRHIRYQNLMTEERAVYSATTLWAISILLSYFSFLKENFLFLTMAAGTAICLLISSFSYIRIYQIVRRHQLQIQSQQQAIQNSNAEYNPNMVRPKKSAINTFIYYFVWSCVLLQR